MAIEISSGNRGSVNMELGKAALAARYAQEAKAAAESAIAAAVHPPVIGENGNWQIWDQGNGYVDSGVRAEGPQGAPGFTDDNIVRIVPQTLTAAQQAQARENIGAADVSAFQGGAGTGSMVTFTAPAAGLPLKSLVVHIEPTQSGSGDPSPGNVRTISGRTSASTVISPTQTASDGETISVTFPAEAGSVYGGTLDLQKGLLTVDRHGKKIKDFSWTYSSNYQRFQSSSVAPAVKPAEAQSRVLAGLLGETYSACAASALQNNGVAVTNNGTMLVKDANYTGANYTTVSAFTAAMGEYLIVYPLAEPIVYQIEPHTIATLLGTNNIWADCGDVSVTWGAYIEAANDHAGRTDGALLKLMACIAPIENGSTASQAYAQSAYFFRGGNFCKAKTAIASGAAFTLDTNYEVTTIAAALFALQS